MHILDSHFSLILAKVIMTMKDLNSKRLCCKYKKVLVEL